MKVRLPFSKSQLEIEVSDSATVLLPRETAALTDAPGAVAAALRRPTAGAALRERVRGGQSVAIVISDLTRPVPNQVLLPPIIDELLAAGVHEKDITIVNGTGLHRPNTAEELEWMLGPELCKRFAIYQHESRRAEKLKRVGVSARGVPVELCTAYSEADVRIVTGFVEPHLFAGYSGGAKGVMPGVAGAEIVMSNHGAANLSHPKARWLVSQGNPVFDEIQTIVAMCPPTFLLNVTLDNERRITGVFAGDWREAHAAAVEQAAMQYRTPISHPYDVVVVTNMGYPADTNLYQSVKGISVAAEGVREGGAILLVAGCDEGLGSDEYVEFLAEGTSPAALLQSICEAPRARHDQWQIQIQAMVQAKCDVYVHSRLARADIEKAHLLFSADASATVRELVARARSAGLDGSVLVMPFGQLTVPVVG